MKFTRTANVWKRIRKNECFNYSIKNVQMQDHFKKVDMQKLLVCYNT